jgi:hypothetical protein
MNSLLPFVIHIIGIDTDIWDLEANGKLLSTAQDALDKVIALEDLGVEGYRLSASDRFYQHVRLCYDVICMLLKLMVSVDSSEGLRPPPQALHILD